MGDIHTSPQQQQLPQATDSGSVNVGQLSIDQLKQILLQTIPTASAPQAKVETVSPQHPHELPKPQQRTQIIVSASQPVKTQLISKPGMLLQ